MNDKLLLVKCITLLYRESQLSVKSDSSKDLVANTIENIGSNNIKFNIYEDKDIIGNLKDTVQGMLNNNTEQEYDVDVLLQQLKVNCDNDINLYEILENAIKSDLSEAKLKRSILDLRHALHNHHRELKICDIINKAGYQFKFQRSSIKNVNDFISELVLQLESMQILSTAKDPAITSEIDIGDEQSTTQLFNNIKETADGDKIFKTGWQWFNNMFHGGIRRGEQVLVNALPHNYKTGFTLSLFKHIPLYNKPSMLDINKKPLLLRLSFEDDLELNVKFLYQSLKHDEGIVCDKIHDISSKEMAAYVKQRLQVNGFHIKMLRIDPTQWTYKHICNKVIEYEAQGYEVHVLVIDYLAMVPTTGCVQGPAGVDIRDLFRRIKNFCAAKHITHITPHQLSTEGKLLIRGSVPPHQLVKELPGKGYYERCRSLDAEIDLEIYINKIEHEGKSYLTCGWGKHRGFVTSENMKYVVIPFPENKMPIPDDINTKSIHMTKLPINSVSSDNNELFNF
jgi:hypothetical protein